MIENECFDTCFLRSFETSGVSHIGDHDTQLRIQRLVRDRIDDRLKIAASS